MKITLSRTAHAQSTTYKCVSLTTSRIIGACIEMADLSAVVFGGEGQITRGLAPGGWQIPGGGAKSLRHQYFKTSLVSSKIADDDTSKNLPGDGRGLSPLSFSRRLRDLC